MIKFCGNCGRYGNPICHACEVKAGADPTKWTPRGGKEQQEKIERIADTLGASELLCQLAEECNELGKAALKLRRAITGTNPTPVTEDEARKNLTEEVADVTLCLLELGILGENMELANGIINIINHKIDRWAGRLKGNG